MRVLVVSDIHSNLHALEAVLEDAGEFDILWSLGDVVGYGPRPNDCIARLEEYHHLAIPGNHDWGVLGKIDLSDFNRDARIANLWTRERLIPSSRSYLETLPETIVEQDFTLAHGSPRHPIWEYLFHVEIARINFQYFETRICLVGHTHVPVIFWLRSDTSRCEIVPMPENVRVQLAEGRYIINPGSVGQPRDGDPRAAYMLIDTETLVIEPRRVAYDIAQTQEEMRQAGLPARNIARLDLGW